MQVIKAQKRTRSTTWEEKEKQRSAKRAMKEKEREMREEAEEARRAERERIMERRRRRAEAELRNAKTQVITNADKVKRMNKKQLRAIHKTFVDDDGIERLVPLYGDGGKAKKNAGSTKKRFVSKDRKRR